ncbi:MAG: PD-(D/E)XK nuclease family protein, partial [Hydrogenimonas sp.]|nr:PD-(D/E)XK nuclease family protein [Hydrogenimonas sp.]
FLEFIDLVPVTEREMEAIDEERHLFGKFASLLRNETPVNLLRSWLQRIEPLHLDDVGGGKATVMGLLESRGKSFDAVVIADFNEDLVPKVGEKDLFLNSSIRRHAGMPTKEDKENLQKNYYYSLLQRSRFAAICSVVNEETSASRFLKELGLEAGEAKGDSYRTIIAPSPKEYDLFDDIEESENPFKKSRRLTPTKIKDYLTCRRRFYYRYLLDIREKEREREDTGSLIHASLEEAVKAKDKFASADEYFNFLMDNLFKRATGVIKKLEISVEWEERLKRFCELDFGSLSLMSQPVVEGWCSAEFEGFTLSAKIDRVDLYERRVRAIDYKTSKNLKRVIEDENDFQLLFYLLWAESVYPEKEVDTLYWDLHEAKEVPVDAAPKRERLKEILRSLSSLDRLSYPKTEDEKECRYCDYKIACGRD